MTGAALVEAARSCLGAPFVWGGRSRVHGCDCAGLILVAAREAGIGDFEPPGYSPLVDSETLTRHLTRFCDRVDYGQPPWQRLGLIEAGDILLFAFSGRALHLGMASGDGTLIHAFERAGRVVEQPFDAFWQRHWAGLYRFRELEKGP